MTARDVAHLLFNPSAIVRVRQLLPSMCGGADFGRNQYLYRFRMPDVSAGNPERVYALGNLGRKFLSAEFGLLVDKRFRPEGAHLSFTQMIHNLVLTRFLVAAHRWAGTRSGVRLSQVRICYELGAGTADTGERGKREKGAVIPDGWLLFQKVERGKKTVDFPVLVEIDRGTMFKKRFKEHVASRIEFVRSGAYREMFGQEAVVIVYATTGTTGEGVEGRRGALAEWTEELFKEQRRESWGRVFRFCSLSYGEIYAAPLFEGKVWYRPDLESAVRLFEG